MTTKKINLKSLPNDTIPTQLKIFSGPTRPLLFTLIQDGQSISLTPAELHHLIAEAKKAGLKAE